MNGSHSFLSEDIEYVLNLPYHLCSSSEMAYELCTLLTEFDFIEYKVSVLEPQLLIEDYDLIADSTVQNYLQNNLALKDALTLIKEALTLSAHILRVDVKQLAGQLLGRLSQFDSPVINQLLQSAKSQSKGSNLYPISSTLKSPKSRLFKTLTGHTAPINAIDITPDGQRIISASEDNTLKVWDFFSGLEILTLSGEMVLVQDVKFVSDGRYAVSAAGNIENRNSNLIVWDLLQGVKERKLIGDTTEVTSIAITPDESRVVSVSADLWNGINLIKVWDLPNGRELQTLVQDSEPFSTIAITPDGKNAVVGTFNGTLKVLDLQGGNIIHVWSAHDSAVNRVAVSPDGKFVVSASSDKTLKVWNLLTRCKISTLVGHTDRVNALDIMHDGDLIVSAAGNTIKVWDLRCGSEVQSFMGHRGINDIIVSPDGRCVISTGNDQTIRIWELHNQSSAKDSNGHTDYIHAIAIDPSGQIAISASSDRTLKVWDINTGEELYSLIGHTAAVRSVVFTPDGRFIVSSSEDRTIRVWDWNNSRIVRTLTGHAGEVTSIAITHNGENVVSTSSDQTVRQWNILTGLELNAITLDEIAIKVAISPDGERAVLALQNGTLEVWDFVTKESHTISDHLIGPQGAFAITPDGKVIVSAQEDCSVVIRGFPNGAETQAYVDHSSWVVDLLIMHNKGLCVSVSEENESTVRVWNFFNGSNLASFTSDSGLRCCAATPDGKRIIAGGVLGQLHFLELINSDAGIIV